MAAAPRFAVRRFLIPLTAAAAALLAALAVGVSSAAAATPCWKQLLNDYFPDRQINKTYQLSCYNQALKHLHPDISIYGSAVDDIKRARDAAILGYTATHNNKPPGPSSFLRGHGGKKSNGGGFLRRLASALGPGNASSIPLPLLILAGLGLLLIAAAGASYAARRIQARRAQARPHPATSPPSPTSPPRRP